MDSKREVVIDCDPGIDDALALMLALGSKDIRVVGITVVCGNVGAALGTVNVCRILELMGRTDIPVIMGAAKPLNKPLVTAQDTHGMDGLARRAMAVWMRRCLSAAAGSLTAVKCLRSFSAKMKRIIRRRIGWCRNLRQRQDFL